MKTINQLLTEIANEPIEVADVSVSSDKQVISVTCWAMKQPHVMQFTIIMPYVDEVVEGYNLGDMGAKIQKGFRDFAKKLGEDDGNQE